MKQENRNRLIFYILLIAYPVIQFAIFYIGVNFNSLLFAFQKITIGDSGYVKEFTIDTMKKALTLMKSETYLQYTKTSIISFLLIFFISTPLGLLFAYFIYKKLPLNSFFRVMLFLPSILSAVVMITIYQFFIEGALPSIVNDLFGKHILGLLENKETRFSSIVFYNIFTGFGTSVLMYSNAMSGISTELSEAAKLDGASSFKEFLHICIPAIWPTIVTFTITSVATIFVNQIGLYSFYDQAATDDVVTYGYQLYRMTLQAQSQTDYPMLSAMGILLTLVTIPVTFLVKFLMERFGPSEE